MFRKEKKELFFPSRQLHHKLAEANKTIVVSVAGVKSGVGTTGFVMMLMRYLKLFRSRGALVEYGCQTGFYQLYESAYGEAYEGHDELYSLGKIDLYPQYADKSLMKLKEMKYQLIIVDYGALSHGNVDLFNDGDIKCLISCSQEWNFHETLDVIYRFSQDLTKSWKFIAFSVKTPLLKQLEKNIGQKLYGISFDMEYSKHSDVFKSIETILGV